MKSLKPGRTAREKQLLTRYDEGELAWRNQQSLEAKSENGAVLAIHNDDELEFTTYDRGSLSARSARGPVDW